MTTVTRFVQNIQQPRGGYLSPKLFKKIIINDNKILFENENIHPIIIGTVIDSFSRFLIGKSPEVAFRISILGAELVGELKKANQLIKKITGFNQKSILAACKLVGYDTAYRAGPLTFDGVDHISPDKETLSNIINMLERCKIFFEKYGPVTETEITFLGGYTDIIKRGDADFLTHDTLWDMKVTKLEPTNKHTLQLIIYYLLMFRANHNSFDSIKNIGIFNPRKNTIYLYAIDNINESISKEIQLLMCLGKEALIEQEKTRINEIIEEIKKLNSTNEQFKKLKTTSSMISFLKNHFNDFDLIYNKPYHNFKSKIDAAAKHNELKYKRAVEELKLAGVGKELAELFIINNIDSIENLARASLEKIVPLIKISKPKSNAEAFASYLIERAIQIS